MSRDMSRGNAGSAVGDSTDVEVMPICVPAPADSPWEMSQTLGVVMYECLTGARPVPGDTWEGYLEASVRRATLASEGLDSDTPPEVCRLIDRMLASQRMERPNMREAFELLRSYSGTPDAAFALPVVVPIPRGTSDGTSEWTSEQDLGSSGSSTANTHATTMTDDAVTRNTHAAPGAEIRPTATRRGMG